MSKKLTKKEVIDKFSKEYLRLIQENSWIQGYLKTKKKWHYSYDGLWLPDVNHLFRLIYAMNPLKKERVIATNEDIYKYVAKLGKLSKTGECLEEALLKLFIDLDKNKGQ